MAKPSWTSANRQRVSLGSVILERCGPFASDGA